MFLSGFFSGLQNAAIFTPILTTVMIFLLQTVTIFPSAKNITPFSIVIQHEKSYHPCKQEDLLIFLSCSNIEFSNMVCGVIVMSLQPYLKISSIHNLIIILKNFLDPIIFSKIPKNLHS
jgi:hypothetical protein